MAANAVTGLIQSIHDSQVMPAERFLQIFPGALELSCWTEDIGDHWHSLYDAHKTGDIEALRNALIDALPDTIAEWKELGRPDCREDWHRAKWPAVLEEVDDVS